MNLVPLASVVHKGLPFDFHDESGAITHRGFVSQIVMDPQTGKPSSIVVWVPGLGAKTIQIDGVMVQPQWTLH